MNIPAVLRTVQVDVDREGHISVEIDGEPYAADGRPTRSGLPAILDEITTEVGTAVRVELREADGTTFSDLALPPLPMPDDQRAAGVAKSDPGVNGRGFRPGEEVAVAYVLCTQTAGADGEMCMRLPAALLTRAGHQVVLVGMTSAVVAQVAESA